MTNDPNKLIPRRGTAIIRRDKPKERSAGGIAIPQSAQAEFEGLETYAYIVRVGAPELNLMGNEMPSEYVAGDRVLIAPSQGLSIIEYLGDQYGIIPFSAILAKVES